MKSYMYASAPPSRTHVLAVAVALRAAALSLLLVVLATSISVSGQTAIWTYHYDNNRTGWNSHETVLTPATVSSTSFALLNAVRLDDQVDAQPLYVPNVLITAGSHQGNHDVVYVATEGNTVYAIDAHTGTVLLQPNFGAPVPYPLGCSNNGPKVGINSTPVIDLVSNTIYVVIYTNDLAGPAYRIHALDLGSLADKFAPQLVEASHTLTDGTTFSFNATYHRQRPGLLLLNGNVYAGFGSFCDFYANLSRGWLLGWSGQSLAPLPANQLLDTQPTSFLSFFLSAIWMSGYGPAADDSGNILFVTGNSDPFGNTYDGVTNIQESVVKVSPDLTTVLDVFTPKNQAFLEQIDDDFGSGGVMVLPNQLGPTPHLAVAAGKVGAMYLMNGDNLGGYSTVHNNVLGTFKIGACWCGPSYFVDSDGAARVIASGGKTITVWKLQTASKATLTNVASSGSVGGGQTPGFFTSISSNGSSNPIIWSLSHPSGVANTVSLYAFDPDSSGSSMTQLLSIAAGNWPNVGGNANLVPVVADGHVFVASNKQLRIFGLKSSAPSPASVQGTPVPAQTGRH